MSNAAGILDGKQLSSDIRNQLKKTITKKTAGGDRSPGLAVILVGEDPASHIYVNNKKKACESVGIRSFSHALKEDLDESDLLDFLDQLNADPEVDGILVQLPLPSHIDAQQVIERIAVDKDVDGFHPYNLGRLASRNPTLRPCTPMGCMALMESVGIDVKGKHACVVGASNIVGRPMSLELLLAGATTTILHRFSNNPEHHIQQADIVVSAVGKPGMIPGKWIKPGAVVIDVGISRLDDGSLAGDIVFDEARQRASWITPVPGGVGPMTIAMLLANTVQAWEHHLQGTIVRRKNEC